jgi:replication initiation protein RepC
MVAAQTLAAECPPDARLDDKWQLLRNLTDARQVFRISDRAIAVLSALLSFHKEAAISAAEGCVVFPSNRKLIDRAHGISESTLRRSLGQLVEAGLIIRKDSPNGKRYPKGNNPAEAFGFDLTPLVARQVEIETAANAVKEERKREREARERITVLSRDIRKVAEFLLVSTDGTHEGAMEVLEQLATLLQDRPRSLTQAEEQAFDLGMLMAKVARMVAQHQEEKKSRYDNANSDNVSANPVQSERHKQDSNPTSILNLEPHIEDGESDFGRARPDVEELPVSDRTEAAPSPAWPEWQRVGKTGRFDVATVIAACPSLKEWFGFPFIRDWDDLFKAAETVRPALGISPSAWQEAVDAMGETGAAVTMATVLQRTEDGIIRNPGGYLRALVTEAISGKFSPAPIVVSLLKARANAPITPKPSN